MKTLIHSVIALSFCSTSVFAQAWNKNLNNTAPNFNDIKNSANNYFNTNSVSLNNNASHQDAEYVNYKRWEYFTKNRLDANGQFVSNGLFNHSKNKSNLKTSNATASANWQYIGPTAVPTNGGGAGRLNAIEFDPTNSNTIWVGAANGGLWKTTNGGTSWTTNTDFLANLSISDIAINPSNINEMYIATGDNNGYELGLSYWGGTYSSGLLKTTDGGNNWTATGLDYAMSVKNIIHKIILFPNEPQTLLVAHRNGIDRTTDGGATWTNVSTEMVYDFELDPSNANIVYSVGNGKCLKSTNKGLTWSSAITVDDSFGKMAIAISPANASKIYVLNELGDLSYSINGATTFSLISHVANDSIVSFSGAYDCVLAVSPTNANEIYVGGINIAKSMDGGITWFRKNDFENHQSTNYVHRNNHSIEYLPGNSSTLFSCNDGGIFKTTDNGNTWADISSNLAIAQYYRIGTAQSKPSEFYLGQQDNGVIVSLTNSFLYFMPGHGTECVVDKNVSGHAIVSYQNGNLIQTNDNWATYTVVSIPSSVGAFVTPLQLDPQDQNTAYAAYEEVYKSSDFGTTWTAISDFSNSNEIEVMTVSPSNSDYIYIGNDDSFYYTHDGGATWMNSSTGLPTNAYNFITSIAVSNTDANKLWMTYSGYANGNKVYMSTDGGATWTNYSGTLPNIPCNTIVEHQNNSNNELYVGTDFGVYYRNNSMSDWVQFQSNLPNVIISELEIVPSLNVIRAATFGRGVWQSSLNNNVVQSINEKQIENNAFVLFPNPSSSVLNIENKLLINGNIEVLNTLGEVVLKGTLSNQINTFNTQALSSGIYFVNIKQHGNVISTLKFIKQN